MKTLQPLRIADVSLASRHVFGIARIDKEHSKATSIEELENWNPIDASRFHNDRLDATFLKPIHQPMQIGREGTEAPHRFRGALCPYGRRMGIEALYRRPRTTKPEPGHKIYPYLLRGMELTRPNQVWAMDITYIPMARGFVYLAVVLDWATRRVLSWRLSITMEAAFCVETLEDALACHGKPDVFNTDQGSQFTGSAFTGVLANNGIAISMDGKGAWRDNVFVERLWRSVKYEEVYLRAYESVGEARNSIGRYLDFYNRRRPHSSLDGSTPDQAYLNSLPLRLAA
jgi:putative transposase